MSEQSEAELDVAKHISIGEYQFRESYLHGFMFSSCCETCSNVNTLPVWLCIMYAPLTFNHAVEGPVC
jgi:hypothetical protein